VSVPGLTPEQGWRLLCEDPLAYIRELAYAHEEALRNGEPVAVIEVPRNVLVLDNYRRQT
jgi:hypothetical protein